MDLTNLERPPALVQFVETQADVLAVLEEIDQRIDLAEEDGITERWEFGRTLLDQEIPAVGHRGRPSSTGGLMPEGLLESTAAATGKSLAELKFRVQFARQVPRGELATAVANYRSWTAIRESMAVAGIRSSRDHEWYTPEPYIEAARKTLGHIDLDPATSPSANSVVQADHIYTAEDEGENQPWSGRVWLNPPYGDGPKRFIPALMKHYESGAVTAAIVLANAHSTDADWFRPLFDHVLCFTDHRLDFDSAGRDKASSSTHGSVFAYLGDNPKVFAANFTEFGPIVRRWLP